MRARSAAGTPPRRRPATIDEYLAMLEPDKRAALARLRRQIHAAAPGLEEGIAYGLAAFRHDGRPLIYMGAAAGHCAIYGAVGDMGDALEGYDVSKGTIRFAAAKPLPATLVKAIVRARLMRNAEKSGKAAGRSRNAPRRRARR